MGFVLSQTVADLLLPPPPLLFAVLIMRWEVSIKSKTVPDVKIQHPPIIGSLGSCCTLEIDVATGSRVSLLPSTPRLCEGQEAGVWRNWSHNHERSCRLAEAWSVCETSTICSPQISRTTLTHFRQSEAWLSTCPLEQPVS